MNKAPIPADRAAATMWSSRGIYSPAFKPLLESEATVVTPIALPADLVVEAPAPNEVAVEAEAVDPMIAERSNFGYIASAVAGLLSRNRGES